MVSSILETPYVNFQLLIAFHLAGHCKNMSEFFLCHHKADGLTVNSQKDNTKLNGFFECHGVHCTKIKKPFSCDRYCSKITTTNVNTLIMHVSWK